MPTPTAPTAMSDERLAYLRSLVGIGEELKAADDPKAWQQMNATERKTVVVLRGLYDALQEAVTEIDRLRTEPAGVCVPAPEGFYVQSGADDGHRTLCLIYPTIEAALGARSVVDAALKAREAGR